MLQENPPSEIGVRVGVAIVLGLLLLDAVLLLLLVSTPLTVLSFVWGLLVALSIPTLVIVLYWTAALRHTEYRVDAGALIIEWGRIVQIVPLNQIRSMVAAGPEQQLVNFRGIRWPGLVAGQAQTWISGATRPVWLFATRPLNQQLLIVTPDVVYGISPANRELFQDTLGALLVSTLAERPPDFSRLPDTRKEFFNWSIWNHRGVQLLWLVPIILNALLFAYVSARYAGLPAQVPLHFDAQGMVDRYGTPAGLFVLPVIGLLAWLFNGLLGALFHQRRDNRPVAYIVWGASTLIQLATWVAAAGILSATAAG